jgi:4-amino-4-deoxy-L-arabinose transferase-like glycosyltransferase
LYILLIGAFFRFVGIQWGDFQYLHPDERFLVWVGSDIQPISTSPEALGAPPSTINTPSRILPEFTYPDCQSWLVILMLPAHLSTRITVGMHLRLWHTPMFVTRYLVQWIYGHSGFNEMTIVGRTLSAIVDLLSVVMVYAIGSRVFNKRVGLLAAAFSAFTVLNIQQSHFFTMDTFSNFFTLLALYFAIRVSLVEREPIAAPQSDAATSATIAPEMEHDSQPQAPLPRFTEILKHPYFTLSIAFKVSCGFIQLNAAPVAFVLPVAFGLVVWRKPAHERSRWLMNAAIYLGVAALVSILVFRILQPYAFYGPGFFGLRPNPQWLANIKEQRGQAAGDIDYPPSLQWARRPLWFSAQNMVAWGMGIPLGILAFLGFLWAGWRILKGDWPQHVLLWLWGGFYFVWQSLQFNPTMRYQMPTYPILAIYAGWVLVQCWNFRRRKGKEVDIHAGVSRLAPSRWMRLVTVLIGAVVLIVTFAWALGFSLIYSRPITRVAASDWIYQNIPGPINFVF